jgi:hypothetical protein
MPIPVLIMCTDTRVGPNCETSHRRLVHGLSGLPTVLALVDGSCLQLFVDGLFCLVPVIAARFRSRCYHKIWSR